MKSLKSRLDDLEDMIYKTTESDNIVVTTNIIEKNNNGDLFTRIFAKREILFKAGKFSGGRIIFIDKEERYPFENYN